MDAQERMLEAAIELCKADSALYYRYIEPERTHLLCSSWIAREKPPEQLSAEALLFSFLEEFPTTVVSSQRTCSPMEGLYLFSDHESALAHPLRLHTSKALHGIIFLYARAPFHFSAHCIEALEQFIQSLELTEVMK